MIKLIIQKSPIRHSNIICTNFTWDRRNCHTFFIKFRYNKNAPKRKRTEFLPESAQKTTKLRLAFVVSA